MKELGICSIVTEKFKSTRSSQNVEEKPNILNQDFSAENINKKWAGDITYIHTIKDGWCYLAAVLDLCSKKVIGHSFGRTMDADLVIEALNNAYVIIPYLDILHILKPLLFYLSSYFPPFPYTSMLSIFMLYFILYHDTSTYNNVFLYLITYYLFY